MKTILNILFLVALAVPVPAQNNIAAPDHIFGGQTNQITVLGTPGEVVTVTSTCVGPMGAVLVAEDTVTLDANGWGWVQVYVQSATNWDWVEFTVSNPAGGQQHLCRFIE